MAGADGARSSAILGIVIRSALFALATSCLVLVACGGNDQGGDPGSSGGPGGSSGSSGGNGGGPSGSSGSSGGSAFSTQKQDGIATYYDADGASAWNCGFPVTPDDIDITALNDAEYDKSNGCGACFVVTGPKGSVTVRAVDRCPGCEKGHLDLSEQAFAKIAEPKAGRVPITYQGVACGVSGNLSYHFKDGSSKYWTAIQIRNHKVPITKVEYQKNGAFVDMPRSDYNYFIDPKGVGDQPNGIKLRITSVDGQVVEDTVPGVGDDKLVPGAVQFK
ncbi:MAG: hypothetical protein KF819_17450 [Labilithrix sp.]|nr:hypothetical protein [Labilithrix sp.]